MAHKQCAVITPKEADLPTPKDIDKHCPPKVDPLKSYFRFNISCQAKDVFESKGISKCDLERFKCETGAIYPWDELYNSLRINFSDTDIYPLIIVMASNKEQIEKAFNFTQQYDLNFSCRGGAHNNAGYSLCNGVVIDQHLHDKVIIHDGTCPTVIISAGCLNGPLSKQLSKHGLALVTGTCPDTGIAGLTLGGGFSFLMRRSGLTVDNLLNIEMILANGKTVNVNEKEYPELFWACKGGGGGNFGLVLNYKFKVEKIEKVAIFQIVYPFEHMEKVVDKWQFWATEVDHDLTSELDINNMPGKLQVVVSGQYVGCVHRLKELLKPMLELAKKFDAKIFIKEVSFVDACRFFTGMQTPKDCRHLFSGFETGNNIERLDYFKRRTRFAYHHWSKDTLHDIKKQLQKAPSNSELLMWALGGKIKDIGEKETAFPHRKALWFCIMSTNWSDPFTEKKGHLKWLNRFYHVVEKVTKGVYVNFSDPLLKDYMHEYYLQNKDRLIELKKNYDSQNVFNFPQSIKT